MFIWVSSTFALPDLHFDQTQELLELLSDRLASNFLADVQFEIQFKFQKHPIAVNNRINRFQMDGCVIYEIN